MYIAISRTEEGVFNVRENSVQFAISGTEHNLVGRLFHSDGPIIERPCCACVEGVEQVGNGRAWNSKVIPLRRMRN